MVKRDARVKQVATADVEPDTVNSADEPMKQLVSESSYDWRIDAALIVAFLLMAIVTRFHNIGDPKSVIFDEVRGRRWWW